MRRLIIGMETLACLVAVACGSDSPTGPEFAPEPPASTVPAYKIAYTASSPTSVFVIESGKATRTVLPGGSGTAVQPVWSPTGKRLAFTTVSTTQTLFVWDSDTNVLTQVASLVPATACSKGSCTVVEPPFSSAWSSDGSRLAFLASGTLRIATFDGSATKVISSPAVLAVANTLRWSYDGASLLFATDGSILSVPVSGAAAFSTVATGLESGAFVRGFELSPDGKKIAITTTTNAFPTTAKLYIWDVASGTRITVDASSFFAPAWSPDGTQVAVSSGAVYVVNRDGSNFRRVTSESMSGRVAWLPDGLNIVYAASQQRGIAIANVVGGAVQLLGNGSAEFAVASR
ncbi:MAG: PD40 domain-containing protein [Gemmatimonadaceae bacterium]|nr:PD40 domain-containing protein [Gemmatimonadaceae bacterium]